MWSGLGGNCINWLVENYVWLVVGYCVGVGLFDWSGNYYFVCWDL